MRLGDIWTLEPVLYVDLPFERGLGKQRKLGKVIEAFFEVRSP